MSNNSITHRDTLKIDMNVDEDMYNDKSKYTKELLQFINHQNKVNNKNNKCQ